MAAGRVVWSVRATGDIEDIFDYIRADSGRRRALDALRRIQASIALLETAPRLGRIRSDLDGEPRGLTVRPWLVLYDVLPDETGVFILRIVDGRRDLSRL